MIRVSHRHGLTRVEVVVLAGISAILLGVLLPAIQQVRADAGQKTCLNNLRAIGMASLAYHDDNSQFAPGVDDQAVGDLIRLLPYVGRNDLYKNFSFDPQYSLYYQNPYNLPPNDGTDNIPRPPDLYGCEGEVDVFLCPNAPQPSETVTALLYVAYGTRGDDFPPSIGGSGHAFTSSPGRLVMARSHYLGMAGELRHQPPYDCYRGIFGYNSHTRLSDLERGPGNTILYAETWGGYVDWNGTGGIPSGFSIGSRSAGYNYSSFGVCPNAPNTCDRTGQSFGLSFGTFGALHPKRNPDRPYKFNVGMADGSARPLWTGISFPEFLTLGAVRNCPPAPAELWEEEPQLRIK